MEKRECKVRFAYSQRLSNVDEKSYVSRHFVSDRERKIYDFANSIDLYGFLESEIVLANANSYTSVLLMDDLSFCLYSIVEFVKNHNNRVLAKGSKAPMSVTILDDDGVTPVMIFLDASGLFGKSIDEYAGEKGIYVSYDYFSDYSEDDFVPMSNRVNCLVSQLEELLEKNYISESRIGLNIVTRTSVVREWQREKISKLKGDMLRYNVGKYATLQKKAEVAKTDDELFSYNACTRGGFAFVSTEHAFVPIETDQTKEIVASFDAVSQYPAQIVSHAYPEKFKNTDTELLKLRFETVCSVPLRMVLEQFRKPFPCAFDALFEFKNLRIKKGSVFEREGIALLQWSRVNERVFVDKYGDMEFTTNFTNEMRALGYRDMLLDKDHQHRLGKLEKAKKCSLWLTELEAWCLSQVYEWDSVEAIRGYSTGRFCKPTDLSVLSVIGLLDNKLKAKGTAGYRDAKIDLNSLFGIECTNEARPSTDIGDKEIELGEVDGIGCLPKNPKAWYQMGQRVAGWGRVVQVIHILLSANYAKEILNGDTDSIKLLVSIDDIEGLVKSYERYAKAYRKAAKETCARVEERYGADISNLMDIGRYELEFVTDKFYTGGLKQYMYVDENEHVVTKLAGVTTSVDGMDYAYENLANEIYVSSGFSKMARTLMGYNVYIDKTITKMMHYEYPDFGDMVNGEFAMPTAKPVGVTINSKTDMNNDDKELSQRLAEEQECDAMFISWEPGSRPVLGRCDVYAVIETEVL